MGREILKTAGLSVDGTCNSFPPPPPARLPGLIAGQIDGVAFTSGGRLSGAKEKPGLHVLVQLTDLLPDYMFNAYGASTDWIVRDHALMVDTVAAHDRGQPHHLPRRSQGGADHR